jgi:hypothetical protein
MMVASAPTMPHVGIKIKDSNYPGLLGSAIVLL